MTWHGYEILDGDITRDFHYEILSQVIGSERAKALTLNNTSDFTNALVFASVDKNKFVKTEILNKIANLCSSNSLIEETWNWEVFGLFLHTNFTNSIPTELDWKSGDAFKFEKNNLSHFKWKDEISRLRILNTEYSNMYDVGYNTFLDRPRVGRATTAIVDLNQTMTIISSSWHKYILNHKQWWITSPYSVNGSYRVTTRYGRLTEGFHNLRETKKTFLSSSVANNFYHAKIAEKRRKGYWPQST